MFVVCCCVVRVSCHSASSLGSPNLVIRAGALEQPGYRDLPPPPYRFRLRVDLSALARAMLPPLLPVGPGFGYFGIDVNEPGEQVRQIVSQLRIADT